MTNYDFVARGSAWIQRAPEDGKDGVSYEIQLDTDSVVLDSTTKKFVTHDLGNVRFVKHEGDKVVDMTNKIINTYRYIILYYGYENNVYKVISYSANEGITDIWNTMQVNVGDDADCYAMKYIWYDKSLPDNDEAMFEKIWSKLDGVPPKELGINILATKMFTVSRNGDSVKSSDVVFGIGTKMQQPTAWITNFEGLTLVEGKYVWTCTKTTLTNGTSYYTGAYCLGECYDFAQVEELYALSDSSTQAPESGWNTSYKVVKGKYLWSCVKVTYNDANISYLNKKCVSYFPNDGTNGTKFTPKGTAYAHYSKASELPSPSVTTVNRKYLVDIDDKSTPPRNTPCVCYYKNTTTFMSDVAAEGDAYNIGGTLWVHDGKMWHDFGSVQGPKGEDGQDALNIDLSTDRLIFDYNSPNFNPSSGSVAIVARHGNTVIDPSEYSVKITSTQNYDAKKASISTSGKSYNLIFKADGIAMITYSPTQAIEGSENIKYPVSSCNIKLAISYNGITYTKTVFMDVSFAQTYGDLKWNTERLYGEFGEFKTNVDNRFTQTASAISLKADAATLTNFKTEYDENGKVVNKRIGEIEVNYKDINISVGNINDGLKMTGINITDGSITMTANKFKLYNNNKEEVFSADENGNGVFKGNITATGGSFGSFQITSYTDGSKFKFYGMSAKTEGTTMIASSTFTVDYNGLYIGSGLQDNGGSVWIGNNSRKTGKDFSWDDGVIKVDANNSGVSNAEISGIGVNVVGNTSHSAIGMKVSATGGKNNYAVYAENGDFRAENGAFIGVHRGNVKKTGNSNYTLEKTDSTIVCNNTAKDISITLPSDALAGTFYRIIKRGKTVTFQSSKKDISLVNNIDLLSSVSSGTAREWINCLWDGECWLMEMSRS